MWVVLRYCTATGWQQATLMGEGLEPKGELEVLLGIDASLTLLACVSMLATIR